jgi:hypothetical protein
MSDNPGYIAGMSYLEELRDEADEQAAEIADLMDAAGVSEVELVDPGMFRSINRVPDGVECQMRTGRVVAPSATFQTAMELLRLCETVKHSLVERRIAREATLN